MESSPTLSMKETCRVCSTRTFAKCDAEALQTRLFLYFVFDFSLLDPVTWFAQSWDARRRIPSLDGLFLIFVIYSTNRADKMPPRGLKGARAWLCFQSAVTPKGYAMLPEQLSAIANKDRGLMVSWL